MIQSRDGWVGCYGKPGCDQMVPHLQPDKDRGAGNEDGGDDIARVVHTQIEPGKSNQHYEHCSGSNGPHPSAACVGYDQDERPCESHRECGVSGREAIHAMFGDQGLHGIGRRPDACNKAFTQL